jgi:murein DD-endopeptidase MepM/ murein hydrolase activator NlpD
MAQTPAFADTVSIQSIDTRSFQMGKIVFFAVAALMLLLAGCSDVLISEDDAGMRAAARPRFQMPVPNGESWSVSTWSGHSPDRAADLNWGSTAEADFGRTIVASYGGTVKTSVYSTSTGYGNYVVIDHGDGWSTLYAHLDTRSVSVGQAVSRAQKIGTCGRSSAKYTIATHLHYEQLLNGSPQSVQFNGSSLVYYQKINITSKNCTFKVSTAGSPLTIRSGPGTGYASVGTVANGAAVRIYKQAYGTTVTGTYGTSNIWDYIGSGWVSDAYIYTGTDGLVAPLQ